MKSPRVFIYCLKCPTTGDVRYIGQTNNLKKRLQKHLTDSSKLKGHLGNWLRSLSKPPVLVVLHGVAENESWEEEERRYISCARSIGMDLVNATDGGDGCSNPSPETRAAMSAAKRGVPRGPFSPEWRAAMSAAKMGVSWPQARRAARRGVPLPPEHCAAISAAKMGVPLPPETRAAMSAAKKGVPWSPARRAAYERKYPAQIL